MNKRGIKRQTLEPKRTELNPLASDFKTALLQAEHITTPIERVIYVNDSNYVKHIPGTNRYTINFPETFMTSSLNKRIIGIRSIQLRQNSKRTYAFTLDFYYTIVDTKSEKKYPFPKSFVFSETYDKDTNPDILDWTDKLNEQWNEITTKLANEDAFIDKYHWECSWDDKNSNYIIELKLDREPVKYFPLGFTIKSISPDLNNTDVKFETNTYPVPRLVELSTTPKIIIPGPLESYNEYLVAASFVGQTSNSYLGYTNMTFIPPKLYELTSSDQSFWIELSNPTGLQPRELPTDGTDLLILEIQLLYEPYSHKM